MLIVSKFHDFYDSITAYGIDKTVVYQRQEKIVKLKKSHDWRKRDLQLPYDDEYTVVQKGKRFKIVVSRFVIGFCGKLYPGVRIKVPAGEHKYSHYHFYELDKAWRAAKQLGVKEDKSNYRLFWAHYNNFNNMRDLGTFFNLDSWKELLPFFVSQNVPVFVLRRNEKDRHGDELACNPRLTDFDFEKVKPPPIAFQEIYMYISGVLGVPARPMVEVSDKTKAAKKGHDGKYSFRKPPAKSRKRCGTRAR